MVQEVWKVGSRCSRRWFSALPVVYACLLATSVQLTSSLPGNFRA